MSEPTEASALSLHTSEETRGGASHSPTCNSMSKVTTRFDLQQNTIVVARPQCVAMSPMLPSLQCVGEAVAK